MNVDLVEKTKKYIFADLTEMQDARLSIPEQKRMIRLRDTYTRWLEYPQTAECDVVADIKKRYKIAASAAYEDIRLIKICIGSFSRVTKDWHRYRFAQWAEEAISIARAKEDAKAMSAILSAYAKGTMLDKEDHETPDYSLIVPQEITLSCDPKTAGFNVEPDIMRKAKKLEERYIREATIRDATLEEEPVKETVRPLLSRKNSAEDENEP